MQNKLNSKEYWENRFNNSFRMNIGTKQTLFFGNLAIKYFPDWLTEDIKTNNLTICDVGCAEGDCSNLLASNFKDSQIIGIDFSSNAIEKAKCKYPEIQFICENIETAEFKHDIIFTSNLLEHFENALDKIKNLINKTKKHFILLVPFQEYKRYKEHFYTFDYSSFPLKIGNFHLSYARVIDTAKLFSSYWAGKQILVIYTNNECYKPEELPLFCQTDEEDSIFCFIKSKIIRYINYFKVFIFRGTKYLLRNMF
jgi:hypothetical protein